MERSVDYWHDKFKAISGDNGMLFLQKNTDYRNAFVPLGLNGIFTILWGDVHKLKVVLHDHQKLQISEDKLEDIFRDISIYGIMAQMLMREKKLQKEKPLKEF